MKKNRAVLYKPSQERQDLILLLICSCVIPFTWLLLLGWDVGNLVSGHDTLPGMFVSLKSLFAYSGDWTQYLYRFDLLGGVKQHDITGCYPIYELCGWLGVSPKACINLTVFFIQISFAFLSIRAAQDLAYFWQREPRVDNETGGGASWAEGWNDSPAAFTLGTQIGLIWLFAFAPVLAWRLGYGHFFLVTGCYFYWGILSLLAAAFVRRLSGVLLVVATLAILHGFSASGYQTLIYGVIFGFPILVALFLIPFFSLDRQEKKEVAWAGVALAASVLLSFRHFAGMLDHARGSDASRSLEGGSVIYSYLTSSVQDWISSIPWANELIPSGRQVGFHHEVNYAFGPLILLGGVWSWRRPIAWGMGLSLFLAVVFSMNLSPLAEFFPKVFPILNGFRVPARAILPFALTLPLLVAAIGVERSVKKKVRSIPFYFLILGGGLWIGFLAVSPPWMREVFVWLLTIAILLDRVTIPIEVVFLVLGLTSVFSFKERLLPFPTEEQVLRMPRNLGDEIRRKAPELESSLVRARFNFQIPHFFGNTGYASEISTLDGYGGPSFRFLSLYAALRKEPIQRTQMVFDIPEGDPIFPVLSQLYNIRYRVSLAPDGLEVTAIRPTPGQAWFSRSLEKVSSYAEGSELLQLPGEELASRLLRQAWTIKTDPAFAQMSLPIPADLSACQKAQVHSVQTERGGQTIRLKVSTPVDCPLTLSTNWMSDLRAYSIQKNEKGGETREALSIFPIYGALTGVWVPAQASEIFIEAVPVLPLWANLGFGLGVCLWLGLMGILVGRAWRRNAPG